MNKKFFTLLTLTFLLSMSSYVFAFSDVEGHWAETTINSAEKINIIKGYDDGSFKPDGLMTRAELVAVVNRLLVIESETDKYVPDVTRQDWFNSDIRKSMNMGILKGDENGFVRPNEYVTREEAILIIARAFGIKPNNQIISSDFRDNDTISKWAENEMLVFIQNQYITGYPDNTLRPKSNITRAEILTILNRVFSTDIYNINLIGKVNGNVLIREKNTILTNVEIYGDLIIGETATMSVNIDNCIINGNLILYNEIDLEKNVVEIRGEIIKVYENQVSSDIHYIDSVYGIEFSLPNNSVIVKGNEVESINHKHNNLVIINIRQDDSFYFETMSNICKNEISNQKYDSIFEKVEEGIVQLYPYALYKDNINSNLLIIKRDNTVYSLLFTNIVSENIVDNVMSNIKFFYGEKIVNHNYRIYKNSKLCLKFSYKDGYVGVDDSYNTGVIYNGDAFFKLFIQVNKITDIDEYSISQVTSLLKTLIRSDGTIVEEKIGKISNHDTIQFEIVSDEDKIISLYVIVGNNLYNFIFKGEKDKMNLIGKDMFLEMVKTMEF